MHRTAPLVLFAALLAVAACGDSLPDADTIADRIAERALADFEGVQDFTVRGEGVVAYFRRIDDPDSLVFFDGRAVTDDSAQTPVPLPYTLPSGSQMARGLRGNARVAGTREVDGETVYVLEANDPGVLIGAPADAPSSLDSVLVFVDAETFRVREVRLTTPQSALNPVADDDAPTLVQRQRYSDFRTVDGLTLPFKTTTTISGVVIPEDARAVQGGMLEFQRQQAQSLSPAERERVLSEIEQQMRFLDTGEQERSFTVGSVDVNAGVPPSLFAPPTGTVPSADTSGDAGTSEAEGEE